MRRTSGNEEPLFVVQFRRRAQMIRHVMPRLPVR